MDSTVSVNVKTLLVTALVALALLTAYLLGSSGGGTAEAADAEPAPVAATTAPAPAGTVTMVGAGEAVAVPDQLGFSLTVNTTRPDLATSLEDANATMQRVLRSLTGLGVERKDVQSTGLSMNPVYDYPSSGPPVLRGYRVSQEAAVLVTELKQGGAAITAAVETGGNGVRVGDIRLSVSDPDAALAKARERAVEAATTKAEEYAAATGEELGVVRTLREVSATPTGDRDQWAQRLSYRSATADAGLAVPIRAGQEDLAVRVEVVWQLA